jgi:predicted CXXCH cytochrome family protein
MQGITMKILRTMVLIAGLLWVGDVWAQVFEKVMTGPHNLTVAGPDAKREDVCIVCHIEGHEGEPPKSEAPGMPRAHTAWDSGNDLEFFLTARTPQVIEEGLAERRHAGCLDCHDGVIGRDLLDFYVNGTPHPELSTAHTGNRTSNHPSGILYPRRPDGRMTGDRADPKLKRYWSIPDRDENGLILPTGPVSANLGLQNIDANDPDQTAGLVRTFSGVMKCESCHNPHDNNIQPYLRVPNKTLCLSCHER